MVKRTYESLDHELESRGYLSLYKAVSWLKSYHPEARISYPTAMKLIRENKIRAVKIGSAYRLYKDELQRFVLHGNREDEPSDDAVDSSDPGDSYNVNDNDNVNERNQDET